MFMDLVLSRRLERAEGHVGASFVPARIAVTGTAAEHREIGGVVAIFDGADSPLTQSFGLGLEGPVTPALLDELEAFFRDRGAVVMHEVSPLAGVETFALLAARGYVPDELSTVLVMPLAGRARLDPPLPVRAIDPARDAAVFIATSVAGWSDDPAVIPFIRSLTEVNVANGAMTHFLVEREGQAIASGSLGLAGDVALFAGASTVASARGQGAQASFLAARLDEAQRRGCAVAMMTANVGSTSQRNAERRGFRVAYTRTKWRLGR